MPKTRLKVELKFSSFPDLEPQVTTFSGEAKLNGLYKIVVLALIKTKELDSMKMEDLFTSKVTLSIVDESRKERELTNLPQAYDAKWHGILGGVETGRVVGDRTFVDFTIVPSLCVLEGQIQNRIHLDMNSLDIVKDSLTFGGFDQSKLKLKLDQGSYPSHEFIFQKDEDLLKFVLRTLENEGIALYYDQSGETDEVVLTDNMEGYQSLFDGKDELKLVYTATTGLVPSEGKSEIKNFRSTESVPPKALRLRDYDWKNPNRLLEVNLDVSDHGRGEVYLYGENFDTVAEGKRIGNIRKEELLTRSEYESGEATVPGIMPGRIITVENHPLAEYNTRYLVTETRFEGREEMPRVSGLSAAPGDGEDYSRFLVEFKLQRKDLNFRPERITERPKATGTVTAWIDGAGSGDTPEMNAYGSYKIRMPLDTSARAGGKASCWVRMAQPSVGKGYGQNFPLTPGAEVILTFVDGNPDRPVIAGAVPNAETGNVINSSCANVSGIGTKGGGSLFFGEEPGHQHAVLDSGSRRGKIGLYSGSPTACTMEADYATSLSSINSTIAGFSSTTNTGVEHKVRASSGFIQKLIAALSAAKEAAEVVDKQIDAYSNKKDDDKTESMAKTFFKGFDKVVGTIPNILLKLEIVKAALAKTLSDPHKNLMHLKADESGAAGVWRSKINKGSDAIIVIGLINNILAFLGQGADAASGYMHATDKLESNASTFQKVMAKGAAAGTPAVGALAEVIDLIAQSYLIHKGKLATKGVVIENTDSYVDILAETAAALSSKGPLILESSADRVGTLMRTKEYDDLIPTHIVTKESNTGTIDNFYKEQAIVLRSPLVRLLADEVSLCAKESIIAKAAKSMQFLTGISDNADYDVMLTAGLLDTDLNAARKAINESKVRINPESFPSGILFHTNEDNSPITLETNSKTSSIILKQGSAGDKPVTLTLEQESATLKADKDLYLQLKADSTSAKLSGADKNYLELKDKSATLQFNDSRALIIQNSGANLKHATKVFMNVGASKMEIDSSGVKFNTTNFTVSGKLLQLL
ncbi:MAG: type VI secretion system tip protein VgrG [Deltaproteobacteria bacterium]|jgi:type VI secretion system VgrG family protein|nr:type VI secretion system tip protein VgrG [Deltaproteobacteria bacterium]